MKIHFNKELVMFKKDHEDFENSRKCWICDNAYFDGDVKVRDNCHITGDRYCNISFKLNHKIPFVFQNLNDYDSHLVMHKLWKLNLKINVVPNGLKKYKSFSINNKLSFIFQFLSSSLDSLVKILAKDYSKYLSQEFDNKLLNLVKRKRFYPYEYMTDFESLKNYYQGKRSFIVH